MRFPTSWPRCETPCGRATVARLKMNDPDLLYLRRRLAQVGFDCTKADFE